MQLQPVGQIAMISGIDDNFLKVSRLTFVFELQADSGPSRTAYSSGSCKIFRNDLHMRFIFFFF